MSRRIVFIESATAMGGVEFSTLYLAAHLNPILWRVTVVCPGEGQLATTCRDAGVPVEIISLPRQFSTSFRVGKVDTRLPNPFAWIWNGLAILTAADRLRCALEHIVPDIVVTKGSYAHLCGGLAARQVGVRCIWHVQDFISERLGGIYRTFFGLFARILADEIVVDGTPIACQLPKDVQNRVSVILNGVDLQVFNPGVSGIAVRQQFSIEPDELVVGHAARITPWKGQLYLLEAFGKLAARYPKTRLLLVGSPLFDNDTYEQRLRSRVQELHLSDQVIFTGFRTDLAQVLAAMDIFAYSSVEKDTSPLALLSAMSCGLPVVAFDIAGVREVVGDEGLLVPVRDVDKMALVMEKLLGDADLRNRMRIYSRERAVACFSLEQHVARMEAVFMVDRA